MASTVEPLAPPRGLGARLRQIGPGLIVAATGVGAGDLVASLVAGTRFGMALLWAVIAGAVLKLALAEGVGRWHLMSGETLLHGWKSLGRWAIVYFGIYIVVWGFVYGAAAISSAGLALTALFPSVPLPAWAVLTALSAFALVGIGRYAVFEKVMTVLVGLMFVTVVGTAVAILPDWGALVDGLLPRVPEGSLVYVAGLVGGVGGTITMAAYGYWLREKRWDGKGWLAHMRLDNAVGYTATGIFVVATLICGSQLLFASGLNIEGEQGLVDLAGVLQERFGTPLRIMFLVGFWAAAYTSVLGVWNGVSYLFADFLRVARGIPEERWEEVAGERSPAFRAYMAWLTFPPLLLLFLGRPVALVLAYTALGALFMPFLAITLLVLLNSRRIPAPGRSGWLSNTMLAAGLVLFAVIAGQELVEAL